MTTDSYCDRTLQIFGKPDPNIPEISQLVQHGFARSSRWEYLGKSSSDSSKLPNNAGDSSVKLDFGLEDTMITDLKWNGKFSLIYSVTLSTEDLETSIVVRNTGSENYSFKFLFHSYFKVNVSPPDISMDIPFMQRPRELS